MTDTQEGRELPKLRRIVAALLEEIHESHERRYGKLGCGCVWCLVWKMGSFDLEELRRTGTPAGEDWLSKNPEAMRMVRDGIDDAKAGRLSDGPDRMGK